MARYRYRSKGEELSPYRNAVLSVVSESPISKSDICSEVEARFVDLVQDPYWRSRVSTACQQLRKEGILTSIRLPGGKGLAWRGWVRKSRAS